MIPKHNYDPVKKQLVILSKKGKPLLSFKGDIAKSVFDRMNGAKQELELNQLSNN